MHRYTLQPYHGRNSRFTCPECNRKHTFTRYIDTETQTHVADHVGKCDRADNCGYHHKPRDYFAANPTSRPMNHEPPTTNHFDTLPYHYVTDTTKAYHRNNFILFLTRCFDEATALRMAALYKIGTSKHWPGATIFWQIDINDKLRTGKIMLYNPEDGHRVKKPFNHITWAHGLLGRGSGGEVRETAPHEPGATNHEPKYNLQQCFFGEHLLNTHPFKTVAIAEAEKTAIICSFIYPEYIWLAAGSLDGLSVSKCRALKGRRVKLYPDLNAVEKWKLRIYELNMRISNAKFTVDCTIEKWATEEERAQGLDMADRWIDQILKK